MIMGFAYVYTYQDCDYTIRTMNTKSESAYTIVWFSCSKPHTRLQSVVPSTFIVSCSGNADKLIRDLNTA